MCMQCERVCSVCMFAVYVCLQCECVSERECIIACAQLTTELTACSTDEAAESSCNTCEHTQTVYTIYIIYSTCEHTEIVGDNNNEY